MMVCVGTMALVGVAGPPGLVLLDTMGHWIRDRRRELGVLIASVDVVLLGRGGLMGPQARSRGRSAPYGTRVEAALRAGARMGTLAIRSFSLDAVLVEGDPAATRPSRVPPGGAVGEVRAGHGPGGGG